MSMDQPPPPPPPGSGGGAPQPAMSNPLVGYWKLVVLERYAQFQGRARRSEYWWFFLANWIVLFVLGLLGRATAIFFVLYIVYALALLVPSLAVAVRRFHDTGKSGWLLLLVFIPLVGAIIVLVFLCIDSTRGTNQYGTSEKYPA